MRKLKPLVTTDDTAIDLDRKMIAVVVKADQPELCSIIRTVLLFAKFQTSFYADPTDAVFKALGVQ